MVGFTKLEDLFRFLSKVVYIFGFPHIWTEGQTSAGRFIKYHNFYIKFIDVSNFICILLEWSALYTQKHLKDKQSTALIITCFSTSIAFFTYVSMSRESEQLKELWETLVKMRKVYDDSEVNKDVSKKSIWSITAMAGFIYTSVLIQGLYELMESISGPHLDSIQYLYPYSNTALSPIFATGSFVLDRDTKTQNVLVGCLPFIICGTFAMLITGWPDVQDPSFLANIFRAYILFLLCFFIAKYFTTFIIVVSSVLCIGGQYKVLHKYFMGLSNYFEDSNDGFQVSDKRYERAVKTGIMLHIETLRCVQKAQKLFNVQLSSQIILNVSLVTLYLVKILQHAEYSSAELVSNFLLVSYEIIITGLLMCSAADITVEAEKLPSAMFASGWHHCHGETRIRMKKTLAIAMLQAQQPVVLRSLGFIDITYRSYVNIIKSSYTIISVFY